jgi:hypothetical protein
MATNVAVALYRGTLSTLSSLVSTGKVGVLAWTTDSMELFVDQGTGTAGYGAPGSGKAWIKVAAANALFTAASSTVMIGLAAQVGDICDRTDVHQNFVLTAFPATTAGNWTALSPDASVTGIVGLASGTAHQWVSYTDTTGTQHLAQPAFSYISGSATAAQLPALSALTGTLLQTQLPTTISSGSSLTSMDCGTF